MSNYESTQVGEHYVWDRCHLNDSSIIKGYSNLASMEVVVLRSKQGMKELAVNPVTHFPLLLDDMVISVNRVGCVVCNVNFQWNIEFVQLINSFSFLIITINICLLCNFLICHALYFPINASDIYIFVTHY